MISIWTDGSGSAANPGRCGCGIVMVFGPWRIEAAYFPGTGTHNVAELKAILVGLRMLRPKEPLIECLVDDPRHPPTEWWPHKENHHVTLSTDSEYAMYSVLGKYKGEKHAGLIGLCREEAARWTNLEIRWVRGHANDPNNGRADHLAGEARQRADEGGHCRQGFARFDVLWAGKPCMTLDNPADPTGRWKLKVPRSGP